MESIAHTRRAKRAVKTRASEPNDRERCSKDELKTIGEVFLNEQDLIQRARENEDAAWEKIVHHHQEAIFRLAYLRTGSAKEAEDVAQETFLRAYQSLVRFDSQRALRPWLLKISSNLARNKIRSLRRYWAALKKFAQRNPESVPGTKVQGDIIEVSLQATKLWDAVRRLHPADQEIIYLRYFLECSVSETSLALQVAAGTVKSRLHRALQRLRTLIESEYPELEGGLGQ